MESNLPATQDEVATDRVEEPARVEPPRPLSVAFLPLALIVFVVLAFTMAAWTFLHASL